MLTDQDFFLYCQRLGLSSQAQAVVTAIRAAPPSRRVGSGRANVPVRFASRKMGVTIQAESYKNELAGVYEMEHDPGVLEFYDQPPPITLHYQAKNGRNLGVLHTADFFVLRAEELGWEEWKLEEDLLRLAETQPHRYLRNEEGHWICPPGEQVAAPLGCYYRVRSSAQIDWTFQRNLRFLADYLREDRPRVAPEVAERIRALVASDPGQTLLQVLQQLETGASDDLYTMLATEQVYVDVYAAPLAEPERVRVWSSAEVAKAWAVTIAAAEGPRLGCPHTVLVQPGAPLIWDGQPWTILNTGETTISLLTEHSRLIEVPTPHFEALVTQGKIVGLAEAPERGVLSTAVRDRLLGSSPRDLEEANRRYALIQPFLRGRVKPPRTSTGRALRRWLKEYREAEETLGVGYPGLLPEVAQRGNRTPRLPAAVATLLETFIDQRYEHVKQKRKREVYGELVNACLEQGIVTPPSYKTFVTAVNRRPRYQQTKKRAGARAAYRHEPLYWELTWTLPRHGDRPFEIGHIDHTELDVELVDSRTGRTLGRPWATLLTDAFSRRVLAVYLTFDEPSYRSCMMVLRECVARTGRLPHLIIVDWGPEFEGTYFETLLARYECSKASRPKAKPRFGSVIERLFGTANTTFVHNLAGNTQVMKNVRQVTHSVNPRTHAVWTLGTLYARLREWAYEVYDTREHPALGQTPREAFTQGLLQSGERRHRLIPFDDEFRLFTLPTTPKGTAKVQPNVGVKINSLYYWAKGDAFRDPEVEQTQVPVRYDPHDLGHAYAFVQGRWVECISEHYAHFQGRSEREIQLATEELRQRHRRHGQSFTVTAAKLAAFITSTEAEEALLAQRWKDEEAKAVFALMQGQRLPTGSVEAARAFGGSGQLVSTGAVALATTADEARDGGIYEDY